MLPGRNLSRTMPIALLTLALTLVPVTPVAAKGAPEFTIAFPQDAAVTEFVSSFGAARPGGRRHLGNDLMAPKMTPVYADADGIVTIMKKGPRSGWYLEIDHGNGWTSHYMHLNNDQPGTDDGRADLAETFAEGLHVGSPVSMGDLIGYVGDSGNAEGTGSHTHFELHYEGHAVNPYPYLEDAYRRALEAPPVRGPVAAVNWVI